MNQQSLKQESPLPSLSTTPGKSEQQIRKEKKKKMAAFKSFLDPKNDPSPLQELPPRLKYSEQQMLEVKLDNPQNCKVCSKPFQEATKICQFCRDKVCISHLRKRRRNPQSNKWARICENCEDRYILSKHYQSEMKTEESLMTQEIIVQNRHNELSEVLKNKLVKLKVQKNRKEELEAAYKKESIKISNLQGDLEKKYARYQKSKREIGNLELSLDSIEKNLPASLEQDYNFLIQQNARMTKDLVKLQKMCQDAVKARCQRQKQMYKEYYEWQQTKLQQIQATEKKEEQCNIY